MNQSSLALERFLVPVKTTEVALFTHAGNNWRSEKVTISNERFLTTPQDLLPNKDGRMSTKGEHDDNGVSTTNDLPSSNVVNRRRLAEPNTACRVTFNETLPRSTKRNVIPRTTYISDSSSQEALPSSASNLLQLINKPQIRKRNNNNNTQRLLI